jgi:NADP-dependent aldehyde dehydrogenase
MITGNIVGFEVLGDGQTLQGVNPASQELLEGRFSIATQNEIDLALDKAERAFPIYRKWSPEKRAGFLDLIAKNIIDLGDVMVKRAMQETGLAEARILSERARTTGQLNMFAHAIRKGQWAEPSIDHAIPDRQPLPKADIRKRLVPLGPVVVFTASNFPLAYSTAGGDVASALAAGCPVIVKAHESHPGTNALVAEAILMAAKEMEAPDGVFSTLYGYGPELGQALVKDPRVKAVGFTGSYGAGRAIMDSAAARSEPIPVYAEMGSLNPVLVTRSALEKRAFFIGEQLGASMTLGAGQFCTKPGLFLVQDHPQFESFIQGLEQKILAAASTPMLNARIHSNFLKSLSAFSSELSLLNLNKAEGPLVNPAIAMVSGQEFIDHPNWHHEVFGPFAIVIKCIGPEQMINILEMLGGQLTATIWSESGDPDNPALLEAMEQTAGRLVWNGVPTGVEVCESMMHGGPFPATSHPHFGAVGLSAIKRWTRPVAYQNFPEEYLPDILKG